LAQPWLHIEPSKLDCRAVWRNSMTGFLKPLLASNGSILLPIHGHEFGAIRQAQRVLKEWAGIG